LESGGRCAEPVGAGLGSHCPVHKVRSFEQHPFEAATCQCENPYGTEGICSRCGCPDPDFKEEVRYPSLAKPKAQAVRGLTSPSARWRKMEGMEKTVDSRKFLSVGEAAAELRLSRASVYRAIASQDLPAVRLGARSAIRIPAEALKAERRS
jgi:excisionase family DNA binding protein